MICDETDLRELARSLKDEYVHLHSLKDARPKPPEVRTMKPAPGPRTPGNWLILSTYIEQEQRLREIAFNAFRDIGEKLHDGDAAAPRLCHLIAFHAQAISELDWASDIMDELRDQERTISRRCNPPESTRGMARRAQQSTLLLTAAHAAKIATASTGKQVTRKQVTYYAAAGYIPTHYDTRGKACYQLSELLSYLQGKG